MPHKERKKGTRAAAKALSTSTGKGTAGGLDILVTELNRLQKTLLPELGGFNSPPKSQIITRDPFRGESVINPATGQLEPVRGPVFTNFIANPAGTIEDPDIGPRDLTSFGPSILGAEALDPSQPTGPITLDELITTLDQQGNPALLVDPGANLALRTGLSAEEVQFDPFFEENIIRQEQREKFFNSKIAIFQSVMIDFAKQMQKADKPAIDVLRGNIPLMKSMMQTINGIPELTLEEQDPTNVNYDAELVSERAIKIDIAIQTLEQYPSVWEIVSPRTERIIHEALKNLEPPESIESIRARLLKDNLEFQQLEKVKQEAMKFATNENPVLGSIFDDGNEDPDLDAFILEVRKANQANQPNNP